jgi:RNA-binding protein YlmH
MNSDKLLFAKAQDRFAAWQKKLNPTFTDFLNPVQCAEVMAAFAKHATEICIFGGYDGAERVMLGFGVDEPSAENFPITAVEITYNGKFSKPPTHRDYLGAALGLGIDRSKIGDIRLAETGAVMYVAADIALYIAENLTQVGRTTVKASAGSGETIPGLESTGGENAQSAFVLPTERGELRMQFPRKQEKRVTVASLRLDAVLSAALNLSRGKVSALIDSDKVFVNWKPAKKTLILHPGDNLTVRGMGRIVIETEDGRTKKDRIVLTITKL